MPGDRASDRERSMAAVGYLLTWLTGLIVYVVADEDERFARWHAIQAIGLGIVFYGLSALLGVVALLLAFVSIGVEGMDAWQGFPPGIVLGLGGGILGGLLPLALIVVIVVLAVKAYNGGKPRLPLIASFADDLA